MFKYKTIIPIYKIFVIKHLRVEICTNFIRDKLYTAMMYRFLQVS